MFYLLLAASLAFCIGLGVFDQLMTVKGIKAGVSVESFTWLVGQKPGFIALFLRDALVMLFCLLPTLLCRYVAHNNPIAVGGLLGPVAYGLHHLQGGLEWRYLLAGGKLDPDGFPVVNGQWAPHSAWQKFIGSWLW